MQKIIDFVELYVVSFNIVNLIPNRKKNMTAKRPELLYEM